MTTQALGILIEDLGKDFISGEQLGESPEQIAEAILEMVLKREQLRQGARNLDEVIAINQETIHKMQSWDSADPEFAILEKTFRNLTTGNAHDAVVYLQKSIQQHADKLSKTQSKRAKGPRLNRRSDVIRIIEEIVRKNPRITEHQALADLRSHPGIADVRADVIEPADGSPSIKRSSLRTHLSNARNKFKTINSS